MLCFHNLVLLVRRDSKIKSKPGVCEFPRYFLYFSSKLFGVKDRYVLKNFNVSFEPRVKKIERGIKLSWNKLICVRNNEAKLDLILTRFYITHLNPKDRVEGVGIMSSK